VEKPDYYVLLGVPRDATPERIKRAYRQLVRRLHPDAAGGSAEQFRALQTAYETLADRDARARYDRGLDRDRGERDRGPAATIGEILLSPEEAARGGLLPLDVPVRTACRTCRGIGWAAWTCGSCDGSGFRTKRLPVSLRLPPGIRDGAVFQIHVDSESPATVLVAVHVLR
jgi:DnaJ-class molecular chaperone